ncbi:MAG: hypothetical protein IJO36_02525 [Clostridia bacterium]|nr:hypothetical protein [Clostridia bacterium]
MLQITQNPLVAIPCGFDPRHRHQKIAPNGDSRRWGLFLWNAMRGVEKATRPQSGKKQSGGLFFSRGQTPAIGTRKSRFFGSGFFNEINPFGDCEIHFVSEILFRNMKCLRSWVVLFHFTFCESRKFHKLQSNLFHVCPMANIS